MQIRVTATAAIAKKVHKNTGFERFITIHSTATFLAIGAIFPKRTPPPIQAIRSML